MNIKALFGGSFNPPHRAHRALAEQAIAQLALSELLLVPAGRPWQKTGAELAPGAHRAAMLELQMQGLAQARVCPIELEHPGPSYSIDTLLQLRQPAERWFLVIGQDQYARLSSWHRVAELLSLCVLAVAGRGGQAVTPDPLLPPHRFTELHLPADSTSSTAIRAAVQRGDDIRPLVGDEVASYISRHNLYGA